MHFPLALAAAVVELILSVPDDEEELTLLWEEEKKLKETATESTVLSFSCRRFSSDKLITESGNFGK